VKAMILFPASPSRTSDQRTEGDEAAIRTAALVLLPSKELNVNTCPLIVKCRDAAKHYDERQRLNLVLATPMLPSNAGWNYWMLAEKADGLGAQTLMCFHFAERHVLV